MASLSSIESRLLSPADRVRVAEALSNFEASGELPTPVFDTVRRLLRLVVAGIDVTVVGVDAQLTSNQAAALLGMSRPLLNKLLDEGHIPYHRNGRDRRIAMSDVAAYINERERIKREHVAAAAGYEQRRAERLASLVGIPIEGA
jgi:excisionase family DNA binding protein